MTTLPSRPIRTLTRSFAVAATLLASTMAWSQATGCLAPATPIQSIDMRVLVIAADGNEPGLPAIRNTLDYVGVPYDVMIATNEALTADRLCTLTAGYGNARYQGVVLTTGNLSYFNPTSQLYESAFTSEEWTRLWQYEAVYRVRQATLYTYPGGTFPEAYGLGTANPLWGSGATVTATLTTAGRTVFPYLQSNARIVFQNAFVYQARATTATPLLQDSAGNAIVSVNNYPDGRQNLAVTADGNPYLMHSVALGYGIVNWVTKGLYIGERRVYLTPQPDDLLLDNNIWDTALNRDTSGKTYRLTRNDYQKFIDWQRLRNLKPGKITADIPFNGLGTVAGEYPGENLNSWIRLFSGDFTWLSHTYTHTNLNDMSYSNALAELQNNHLVATNTLRLQNYDRTSLVTPEISGLNNAEALRAMKDFGIRYIVSDTSKFCGHRDAVRQQGGCPKPNTGIYHDLQPSILMIPRYPTNLFYNVSTPAEWVDEYNFIYNSFWGRDLTYAEILDKESDLWMTYMLNHDMRPLMFHQANMRVHNGTFGNRSLLSDLIDRTIEKYSALYNLPPNSLPQSAIGAKMASRMALSGALAPASGSPLTAKIVPGSSSSTVVISNPTAAAVVVPVTGVSTGSARETYGGQTTSQISVNRGATVSATGAPRW